MYRFIRNILFYLPPETSHHLTLKILSVCHQLGFAKLMNPSVTEPISCMGLIFPNQVGLAAGFDKNGDYISALRMLGFGWIEIGTVTPNAQVGNDKPRLFRLPNEQAIINRMGFNNKGADYVANQLADIKYSGILGINIGKNKATSLENAQDDYVIGFRKLAHYASYITINISSPNTKNLRNLQRSDYLPALLATLKQEQAQHYDKFAKYVPLVVKISPDLNENEIIEVANILLAQKIDGVIATNTTISRPGGISMEAGGLSGKPLRSLSTRVIKILAQALQDRIPIIACGGIMDAATAQEKLTAGATLIQLYTGFIYRGPPLISEILGKNKRD